LSAIPAWFKIMVVLTEGPIIVRSLARRLAPTSFSTIYRHLKWLEGLGWVESERSERMGNVRVIKLTEEGVKMAALCVQLYHGMRAAGERIKRSS